MKTILLSLLVTSTTVTAVSASGHGVPIPDRVKGAHTVVVATVMEVIPTFDRNAYGDRLIVSHTLLLVEEALKGQPPLVLSLDVEGGTIGDLTLSVSDMETIGKGERGVFFITRDRSGNNVPHLRGNGIVKLDAADRVRGSNATLDEVKRQVKQGAQ